MRHGRCPKCHGNLYFEADLAEGLMLRKCLQCGMIESYFWIERVNRKTQRQRLHFLPPDAALP